MPLTRFGVSMEHELVELLDELVEREGYTNRSEALRSMVRKELARTVPKDDTQEIAGIITLIYRYGHKRKEAPTVKYPSLKITANLQVHLQDDICQKIITVQGSARDVITQRNVIGSLTVAASQEMYRCLHQ